MGPILTIALGIVLGFLLLALITWLLGMLFYWIFGDQIASKFNSVIGNVKTVNVNETFGLGVNDVTSGSGIALGCANKIY